MSRIDLSGLSKRYAPRTKDGGAAALAGLDLTIDDGELLVLVGPSGCGKSTALRLIAGLEEPTSGRIELDGRDLAGVPPQQRDVAMVFQGYALYPHMKARDIMAFPLKMRGVARAEREERVAAIAEMVGLTRLLDRLPGELSGGERQRVAMGRAIVRSPAVFLFDEPLSNLDAKLRGQLRIELARLVRQLGTTAVYVTHDQAEAMTMGDRIAVLRDGVLQQVGPPRALYQTPANAFVATFLGTPAMNLLRVTCSDGEAMRAGLRMAIPEGVNSDAADVGIRAEHLTLCEANRDAKPRELAATVASVEPLGADSFVHVEADGALLCVRCPGFSDIAIGTDVLVAFDPEQLHWFDPTDGARIGDQP